MTMWRGQAAGAQREVGPLLASAVFRWGLVAAAVRRGLVAAELTMTMSLTRHHFSQKTWRGMATAQATVQAVEDVMQWQRQAADAAQSQVAEAASQAAAQRQAAVQSQAAAQRQAPVLPPVLPLPPAAPAAAALPPAAVLPPEALPLPPATPAGCCTSGAYGPEPVSLQHLEPLPVELCSGEGSDDLLSDAVLFVACRAGAALHHQN
ncbi:hypothetical protein PLESTM_000375600 [Pleodorina starrii]|nr:hypothetical protein PLESTM_000375600 [Pleodorina starrii]